MADEGRARRREGNEIEFSRIVAFSDGVFAIAITLLVLNLDIPTGLVEGEVAGALWDLREHAVAYAISFAVIGRFWLLHHRFFGDVTGFDHRLLWLNLAYLGWIVLIPFSSEVLGEYGNSTAAVVLYSVNLVGVVLLGMLMSLHAQRAGVSAQRRADHVAAREHALYIAAVFAASIPVAFAAPGIAPLMWLALFLDLPGMARRRRPGY